MWAAAKKGQFAGAIAIDGTHAFDEGARLRWFIVAPQFQKAGIGKNLILRAIDFCKKQHFPKVFLWTFKGLEDARRLYESVGFVLCEENEVAQWGQIIREQKYELELMGS